MQFECYICNESEGDADVGNQCCALIPCGHVYHKTCIETWRKTPHGKVSCPVCRRAYKLNVLLFGLNSGVSGTAPEAASVLSAAAENRELSTLKENYAELTQRHRDTLQDLETEIDRCEHLEIRTAEMTRALEVANFKLSMYTDMFGQESRDQIEELIANAQNN